MSWKIAGGVPRTPLHNRLTIGGQGAGNIVVQSAARDMGHRVNIELAAVQNGQKRRGVAPVRGQKRLANRCVEFRNEAVNGQPGVIKQDMASKAIAVGMQSVRGEADKDISGRDPLTVQNLAALHNPDNRADQIVIAVLIHPWHFRRLAADESAVDGPAAFRQSLYHVRRHLRV